MSRGKKVLNVIVIVIVVIALLGSGFLLGWASGRQYPQNIEVTGVSNINPASGTISAADFSTFWLAWQDINDLYLRNPSTTNQEKVYGAINGLVNSLGDPYTEFFDPSDNSEFQQDITGNFGGIGAELGATSSTGQIVVIAPIKGTPAEAAGLMAGDEITSINGSSTASMTIDQAVDLIRGNAGTNVTLGIFRPNAGWSAPKNFTITRANISEPTVEFSMKGDIAYIQLAEFTQDADSLFYNALMQAQSAHAQGIVLDLRGDPGGYLQVAVDLAGYFLKPGSLVAKEVGRTVPEVDYTASGNGEFDTMPMAVLIDGGSASAAEILSGALNDDRNIPLVGEKSFGKGTVQQLVNLPDGSALKITVAHWVLPSGRILDYDGLVPNYVVSSTPTTSDTDPQLTKALQVVGAEIDSK